MISVKTQCSKAYHNDNSVNIESREKRSDHIGTRSQAGFANLLCGRNGAIAVASVPVTWAALTWAPVTWLAASRLP